MREARGFRVLRPVCLFVCLFISLSIYLFLARTAREAEQPRLISHRESLRQCVIALDNAVIRRVDRVMRPRLALASVYLSSGW